MAREKCEHEEEDYEATELREDGMFITKAVRCKKCGVLGQESWSNDGIGWEDEND